jgi:hypothetical protein
VPSNCRQWSWKFLVSKSVRNHFILPVLSFCRIFTCEKLIKQLSLKYWGRGKRKVKFGKFLILVSFLWTGLFIVKIFRQKEEDSSSLIIQENGKIDKWNSHIDSFTILTVNPTNYKLFQLVKWKRLGNKRSGEKQCIQWLLWFLYSVQCILYPS